MKPKILSVIILNTAVITTVGADESQIMHLLHPTFEELQTEFVFGEVTCYFDVPDEVIDKALDKHFHRIEFMYFAEEEVSK